jgi:hypothetical protein
MFAANDLGQSISASTIAGHGFSVKERTGGLLSLRITLGGSTTSELALKLAGLPRVRITRGPEGLGRGRCYLAHCPGFKLVLSTDEAGDSVLALVSRTPGGVGDQPASELGSLLASLMDSPPPSVASPAPLRPAFKFDKPSRKKPAAHEDGGQSDGERAAGLRRTPLAAGKPLARKTPLTRKTPLGRRR